MLAHGDDFLDRTAGAAGKDGVGYFPELLQFGDIPNSPPAASDSGFPGGRHHMGQESALRVRNEFAVLTARGWPVLQKTAAGVIAVDGPDLRDAALEDSAHSSVHLWLLPMLTEPTVSRQPKKGIAQEITSPPLGCPLSGATMGRSDVAC